MAVYHRWRIYCHMWADCPYNGMDKFWAQCSVTSMGSLCLFTVITALISTSDHADVCENKNNFRNVNTFWRLLRGTKITADVCFWPKNAFSVSVSKCSLTECCNAWLLASCSILVTQKKQNFSVMLTSVLMVARCPDQADCKPWMSLSTGMQRYARGTLWTHLHTRTVVLKINLYQTDSQWTLCRTGITWSKYQAKLQTSCSVLYWLYARHLHMSCSG